MFYELAYQGMLSYLLLHELSAVLSMYISKISNFTRVCNQSAGLSPHFRGYCYKSIETTF